jgi:hypothetical protein
MTGYCPYPCTLLAARHRVAPHRRSEVEDAHWIDEVSESMLADFPAAIPHMPSRGPLVGLHRFARPKRADLILAGPYHPGRGLGHLVPRAR